MDLQAELTVPRDARFVPTLRRMVEDVMQVKHAPTETVDELQVALGEACANVIRHAEGSDSYTVEVQVGENECQIHINDQGPGFQPEADDFVPGAVVDEHGRGLALMRALVEQLDFHRDDDGMHVSFSKSW